MRCVPPGYTCPQLGLIASFTRPADYMVSQLEDRVANSAFPVGCLVSGVLITLLGLPRSLQLATCAGFTGLMAAIFVVIYVRLVGTHAEIVDLVTAMLMRTTLLPWTGFLGSRAVANLVRPCAAAVEVLEEHLSSTTGGGYQPVAQKDASS